MEATVYGPKPPLSFAVWLRSFFKWRDVGELGIWKYQQNEVTGQRRALRRASLYAPVHMQWIQGGNWELTLPRPPTGQQSASYNR